jgi:hypothetical protein
MMTWVVALLLDPLDSDHGAHFDQIPLWTAYTGQRTIIDMRILKKLGCDWL